jgi:hypothetical protein
MRLKAKAAGNNFSKLRPHFFTDNEVKKFLASMGRTVHANFGGRKPPFTKIDFWGRNSLL